MPVRLPVGRLRLLTRPRRVGSSPTRNMTGIVVVAAWAASAAGGPPVVTITAGRRRTSSDAISLSCSALFSAQRNSILTFSPSANPASFRPRRNAARRLTIASDDLLSRNPITGIAGCCARAASGHRRRAADQRDELAPSHSITSSARASRVGEMVTPIALAVFRLTVNMNFVAICTGRSAGFRPLKILSTKTAASRASASWSAE